MMQPFAFYGVFPFGYIRFSRKAPFIRSWGLFASRTVRTGQKARVHSIFSQGALHQKLGFIRFSHSAPRTKSRGSRTHCSASLPSHFALCAL
jgi:hypothetical protein